MTKEPLGVVAGQEIYLTDIWPSNEEVNEYIQAFVGPEAFRAAYAHLFDANERWNRIDTTASDCYAWEGHINIYCPPTLF